MGRNSTAKEKLIRVAFDLVWSNSYGGVSVDQICCRARVNKGSFYHFFPSKTDLVLAAYEAHWKERRSCLDQIFSPQVPPLERLQRYCQAVFQGQMEAFKKCGSVLGCPFAAGGSELSTQEEKIRRKAHEMFDRGCCYIEAALSDAQRQRLLAVGDPGTTAHVVMSLVLGMLLQAKIKNDPRVLQDLEPGVMRLVGAAPAVARPTPTRAR